MSDRSVRLSQGWRWLILAGSVVGVAVTVGYVVAALAAVLGAISLRWRQPRLLSLAAFAAMVLVPLTWFAGSGLPLSPPAPRIQDNTLAHHVGGLAVWLMFVAVVLDENRWGPDANDRETFRKEEENAL